MQGTMNAIATGGATPVIKQEIKKPQAGFEAQGFAIAMRVMGISRTAARELHRCVVSLFELAPESREAAAKYLGTRKEAIAELMAQGRLDEKEAKKMLASANVYASQMRTIIKAINAGMTKDTILSWANGQSLAPNQEWAPDAFDNVGFAVIYKVAVDFTKGEAAGRGRPKTAFAAKLAAWLNKNQPAEDDAVGLALYNKVVAECNAVNAPEGEDAPM